MKWLVEFTGSVIVLSDIKYKQGCYSQNADEMKSIFLDVANISSHDNASPDIFEETTVQSGRMVTH